MVKHGTVTPAKGKRVTSSGQTDKEEEKNKKRIENPPVSLAVTREFLNS